VCEILGKLGEVCLEDDIHTHGHPCGGFDFEVGDVVVVGVFLLLLFFLCVCVCVCVVHMV
jgi:hypothetical protein